jgi:2-polyprenyl-3-methyl-5-hydroxy-6-metoxy-1,4-benzoquinol methylase
MMRPKPGVPREDDGYMLGHRPGELRRLGFQARLIDPITRRFLVAAGVAPGMRVLDVGSGAGDVSFLAADVVGDGGSVTGVDRSADAIATATAAAAARALTNVSFVLSDLDALTVAQPFDAIIGRYVLEWLPDPARTLGALARHARPGGVVVFHEVDWGGSSSHPPAPLFDATCRWLSETIRRSGADIRGTHVYGTFRRAGLGTPTMRLEALIGGGHDAEPIDQVANLAMTVADAAEMYGVASIPELDLETLRERLRAEAEATDSVLIAHGEVGAWVRLP